MSDTATEPAVKSEVTAPVPAPSAAPLGTLDCKMDEGLNNPEAPLTVGAIFKIECTTPSFTLNPSQLKLETPKPYQLKLLQSEVQPDGRIFLKVTSYQVGEIPPEGIILSDGVNKVSLTGIKGTVASVIDKNNPPKGPYGPFGGFVLSLPLFYLWAVLLVFGLSFLWMGFRFYRRWQKKRLIEGLKKHDSRLSPLTQLHMRFRQLERQRVLEQQKAGEVSNSALISQFVEMDEILRVYLIRQFKIPAQDWSDRLILKDFQNRFVFLGKELSKELRVLLREIKKNKELAQKVKSTMDSKKERDLERLTKQMKRWADQMERNLGPLSRTEGAR